MNLIRYILDFFKAKGAGSPSVNDAKGHSYPVADETQPHIGADFAEIVSCAETRADAETEQPTPILIPASMLAASTTNATPPSVVAESPQSGPKSPEPAQPQFQPAAPTTAPAQG